VKHKQETRRISALARRKADIEEYTKIAALKVPQTLGKTEFTDQTLYNKTIAKKLEIAKKDVANLEKHVVINPTKA